MTPFPCYFSKGRGNNLERGQSPLSKISSLSGWYYQGLQGEVMRLLHPSVEGIAMTGGERIEIASSSSFTASSPGSELWFRTSLAMTVGLF